MSGKLHLRQHTALCLRTQILDLILDLIHQQGDQGPLH